VAAAAVAGTTVTLGEMGRLEVEVVSARQTKAQGVRVAQGLQVKEILVELAEETQVAGSTAGVAAAVELEPRARKAT